MRSRKASAPDAVIGYAMSENGFSAIAEVWRKFHGHGRRRQTGRRGPPGKLFAGHRLARAQRQSYRERRRARARRAGGSRTRLRAERFSAGVALDANKVGRCDHTNARPCHLRHDGRQSQARLSEKGVSLIINTSRLRHRSGIRAGEAAGRTRRRIGRAGRRASPAADAAPCWSKRVSTMSTPTPPVRPKQAPQSGSTMRRPARPRPAICSTSATPSSR